ncbi:hypothetical protein CCACVL1_10771 [Corchorus capsularis]|uniref:3'-5' exonuclease domain-containing protein n=1 Tax=Corchorus capsularis TaxID=210143 RepID=A0A1R3IPR0_COCAP|nr:hypothetical protein CCACVL1_10771 [Corchorus capsularis]
MKSYSFRLIRQFFDNKDIVFVGVHIKDDVVTLRNCYGLIIPNAVDLSEMAVDVLHEPRLRAFGARLLASEVLLEPFKARSASVARANWVTEELTHEQIECATTDAYAAYKVGKKLLRV